MLQNPNSVLLVSVMVELNNKRNAINAIPSRKELKPTAAKLGLAKIIRNAVMHQPAARLRSFEEAFLIRLID